MAQSDDCNTPTLISGLGTFPFNTGGATASFPGTPGLCFPPMPVGFGPATMQNDLWFLWVNDTCTDPLITAQTCGGGPNEPTMVALYYGFTSCPSNNDHARCCNGPIPGPAPCAGGMQPALVTCETGCCDLVLIQVGLPAASGPVSGQLTIQCNNPVGCGRPQACCMEDGSCRDLPADCCTNLGGIPQGIGVHCAGDLDNDGIDEACCSAVGIGPDLAVNLATGWDDAAGAVIPVGGNDDDWVVTAGPWFVGPLPHPGVGLTPNIAWCGAFAGSRWLGPIAGTQGGANYAGQFVFRNCFCLKPEFSSAAMQFDLRVDNGAAVYLVNPGLGTSHLLATAPLSSFDCSALTSFSTTNQALFGPGLNCVEVRVNNTGGAVGFDMTGLVTADNARCCCAPLPDRTGCEGQACGDVKDDCRPTSTTVDPNTGQVFVTSCECVRRQCVDDCGDLRLCNGVEACLSGEICEKGEPPCGAKLLCDEAELVCRVFDRTMIPQMVYCLTGPGVQCDNGCEMFDVEFDGDCDLADEAVLETLLEP